MAATRGRRTASAEAGVARRKAALRARSVPTRRRQPDRPISPEPADKPVGLAALRKPDPGRVPDEVAVRPLRHYDQVWTGDGWGLRLKPWYRRSRAWVVLIPVLVVVVAIVILAYR